MRHKKFPESKSPGAALWHYIIHGLITVDELAERTQLPSEEICRLVTGQSKVTPEIAARLACALHTTARFWLGLQEVSDAYREHRGRQERL